MSSRKNTAQKLVAYFYLIIATTALIGIKFDKHIFEFLGGGEYKYLGPDYPYTGKIFHRPQHKKIKEVGEWINGVKHLYPTE